MVLVDVDITATGQDGIANKLIHTQPATTNTSFYVEYNSYDLYFNATKNRIVFPNTITPTDYETYYIQNRPYFIFNGITIPMGATIDDATLTFSIQSSPANFGATWTGRVYGRKTASPTPYGTTATGTGVFTKPIASVYAPFAVSGAPTSTTRTQKAVDIQGIVQELVNTFDYNNDNMMFILRSPVLPALQPTTVTPTSNTQVTASIEAEEDPATNTANLTINYTVGAPTKITVSTLQLELANAPEKTFTVNALLKSLGDNGCTQTTFLDTIGGNSSLWTEVDGAGQIEIDLAGSGVLEYNILRGGGITTETFAHRQIPPFPDNVGRIELRVKVDKISDSSPLFAPTARFIVLQPDNLHPRVSVGSNMQIGLGSGTTNGGVFAGVDDGTTGITTSPHKFRKRNDKISKSSI